MEFDIVINDIQTGNFDNINILLENNDLSSENLTIIFNFACKFSRHDVSEMIFNKFNYQITKLLYLAILYGFIDILIFLINRIDINSNRNGIHIASDHGYTDILKLFVDNGGNPLCILYNAYRNSQWYIVKYVTDKYPYLYNIDNEHISDACVTGNISFIEFIVSNHIRTKSDGHNLLKLSLYNNYMQIAHLIINNSKYFHLNKDKSLIRASAEGG